MTSALPMGRRAFRSEVQALRALAVAAVVLYHLWPGAVTGGFVGVDVFFVISGFLITQHLAEEILREGRISLTQFWARRIRRILPAAFVVLLACVGIVVLLMPRVTWQHNLGDIKAASAYYENWLLGAHAVDYLAAGSSPSLVQHYWSLSVEEQFYIAWPLLMLVVVAAIRWVRGARTRAWLVLVLGAAAATSFVVSVTWTAADPAMAFFATPTRAWEFAAGGLVGVLVPAAPATRGSPGRALLSWLGLAVVLYSVFGITQHAAFPGTIALLPVLGAAAYLGAGRSPAVRWSPDRGAGLRPVQWLGDNSYSVYLWHWPLIVAAPWVLHRALGWPDKLVLLAMSLGLAALTKRYVEDPVRRGELWRARGWLAYAFAAAGVAGLVAVSSGFSGNVARAETAARVAAGQQTRALVASAHRSCFGAAAMVPANRCTRPYARPKHLDTTFAAGDGPADPCLQKYDAGTPALCTFGRTASPRRVVAVVGNSHAWRLVPALRLYAQQHRWEVVVATRINCLGLITTPTGSGASPQCLRWSAAMQRELLALPRLDAVIFASYRYTQAFTDGVRATAAQDRATAAQVLSMWRRFDARGTRVIVTEDVPGMRPTPDPDCLAQSRARYDPCSVPRASVVKPNLTTTLAQSNPGLAGYVPLSQYFCDAARCHALIGGVVVYFDSHHMTTTYSRSLARYLGAAVDGLLRTRGVAPRP